MSDVAEVLKGIRANLSNRAFQNEAAVSQGAVLPILHALGWNAFDTKTVWPEFSVAGRRVDFALCSPQSKPKVFIEVKQVGQADGAEKQLFEYAFHEGIPLAVLTDGQVWNFFLPSGQGHYAERKFYVLDVLSQDVEESINRFERYLKFENVKSDLALEIANKDYKDKSHKRQAQETLPEAWSELLDEPDDALVSLLMGKAESLSGFTPEVNSVVDFLRSKLLNSTNTPAPTSAATVSRQAVSASENVEIQLGSEIIENLCWEWTEQKALGFEVNGGFLVKAGAVMSLNPKESLAGGSKDKYQEIRRSNSIRETHNGWEFTQDVMFKSKAQATNVLCGHSESANRVWHRKN